MIVSTKWIKDYIDFNLSLERVEEGLTALGLECALKTEDTSFSGITIGKVLSVDKVVRWILEMTTLKSSAVHLM